MPQSAPLRKEFRAFVTLSPRWRDADVYGHINNAVFYEYVDTTVNEWLITSGALPVPQSDPVGLVVHSQCTYFAPLKFPGAIEGGLGVERIGNSSVTYRIGLFQGSDVAAALALFTHVYVGAKSRKPEPLPDGFRDKLNRELLR